MSFRPSLFSSSQHHPSRSVAPGSGTHGQGHAENHDWYQELKQPGTGYSCCNGTINGIEGDCRPTRAYLTEEGQWRALIDGQWVLIPPRAVLKQLAPDGRSPHLRQPQRHDLLLPRRQPEELSEPRFVVRRWQRQSKRPRASHAAPIVCIVR